MKNQDIDSFTDYGGPPWDKPPLPKPQILKNFTHRKGKPYCIVRRDDGTEWLVSSVLDNGRLMKLIMRGTDGHVSLMVAPQSFHRFHVILSPEDINDE